VGDPDQFKVSGFSGRRLICGNCKKQIHSMPNQKVRCNNKECECKCRTHYVSRNGIALIPYGAEDPYKSIDVVKSYSSETELLLEQWRKSHPIEKENQS
jgi:hypothetical protein